jgi:glycosyltransferase involved in cell wall biosynthesis/peptidoglycan/xylan/chitin deacetylase (PgdA/CDA1 family)
MFIFAGTEATLGGDRASVRVALGGLLMTVRTDTAVSVIIPAYNAADTIAYTLASLLAQTHDGWEAIVVDDGSTDDTARIAGEWAARDPRIRLLPPERGGVGAARNRGIAEAKHPWIQFLDADDQLQPEHLAHMAASIRANPDADLHHCAWRTINSEGALGPRQLTLHDEQPPFVRAAYTCPFIIHAAVTRRTLIVELGGFETDLKTSEDWDLWQRIARTGAEFVHVPDTEVYYTQRPGSASRDVQALLRDGLIVMRRGHSRDERLANPDPRYADGGPAHELAMREIFYAAWAIGVGIGQGIDPAPLIAVLEGTPSTYLRPDWMVETLIVAVAHGAELALPDLGEQWHRFEPLVVRALDELEKFDDVPRFRNRVLRAIERFFFQHYPSDRPFRRICGAYQVRIDADAPLPSIAIPDGVERIHCLIVRGHEPVSRVELMRPALFGQTDMGAIVDAELGRSAPPSPAPATASFAERARARLRRRAWRREHPPRPADPAASIPVLMYHSVTDSGPASLARFRVSPAQFDEQLGWLKRNGFTGLTLRQFQDIAWGAGEMPERPVLITFDDGYCNVLENAAPILQRHGFPATIFIVAEIVGERAHWDAHHGEPAPLMSWDEIRAMREMGFDFACHTAGHLPVIGLTPGELADDMLRARAAFERELGEAPQAICYPFGQFDQAIARFYYDAGFKLGFAVENRAWSRKEQVMTVPRFEVYGHWDLEAFAGIFAPPQPVASVNAPSPSPTVTDEPSEISPRRMASARGS